jgi:hypothetical protein
MGNPVQGVLDRLTGGQQQQQPQAGQQQQPPQAGQQQQPPAGQPPAGAGNQQQQQSVYTYRCIENCTYSGRFYRTGETIDLRDQQDVPHFERVIKE